MPDPQSTKHAEARRDIGAPDGATARDAPSAEVARRVAYNRFCYSGGFDGYEGRMIPGPKANVSARSPRSRPVRTG